MIARQNYNQINGCPAELYEVMKDGVATCPEAQDNLVNVNIRANCTSLNGTQFNRKIFNFASSIFLRTHKKNHFSASVK
jgi:hypothetical protein